MARSHPRYVRIMRGNAYSRALRQIYGGMFAYHHAVSSSEHVPTNHFEKDAADRRVPVEGDLKRKPEGAARGFPFNISRVRVLPDQLENSRGGAEYAT